MECEVGSLVLWSYNSVCWHRWSGCTSLLNCYQNPKPDQQTKTGSILRHKDRLLKVWTVKQTEDWAVFCRLLLPLVSQMVKIIQIQIKPVSPSQLILSFDVRIKRWSVFPAESSATNRDHHFVKASHQHPALNSLLGQTNNTHIYPSGLKPSTQTAPTENKDGTKQLSLVLSAVNSLQVSVNPLRTFLVVTLCVLRPELKQQLLSAECNRSRAVLSVTEERFGTAASSLLSVRLTFQWTKREAHRQRRNYCAAGMTYFCRPAARITPTHFQV